MPRVSPRDDQYPPALSQVFVSLAADADLTAVFPDAPHAACQIWLSVPASFGGGNLVVRMEGAPSTDVTIPVSASAATDGKMIGPIRGKFVAIDEATTDLLSVWVFWQGGAS